MSYAPHKLVPEGFSAVSSLHALPQVSAADAVPEDADTVAFLVTADGTWPDAIGASRESLAAAAFEAEAGSSVVLPHGDKPVVVVGLGKAEDVSADSVRDAAATAARATAKKSTHLAIVSADLGLGAGAVAQALAEGAQLARYRYRALKAESKERALGGLTLVVSGADEATVASGIAAAEPGVRAAVVARDLANTPAGFLSAENLADEATRLGAAYGFAVEAYDKAALIDMGCGGLLGVNAGSADEPRMIVLRYNGGGDRHLGLVGKGIMYDSGGISLKPSDPMHLLMKIDMGGAAAVLGAFTALRDLGVTAKVSAWLMCTDNMPSGTATKLGDVLVARGGKTVEVKNTDAEGRLVMMDGLVLATEDEVDAVIDIATLTGAALMALGKSRAALFGNNQDLVDAVKAAAEVVDEPVWQMPLEKKYRKQLDSDIADIANLGGPFAGATTAALFLNEFVGETPWAHVDIAGTMQAEADDSWRSAGATGYGARLLAQVAKEF
ncbi:leucyl aminopeptidase family protein [Demequina sp.]|uniref:leucyl aminopeptidase family protein n=1 Tax=Demequina sp. TaxID=2050685 RepID=UPI003D14CAFD